MGPKIRAKPLDPATTVDPQGFWLRWKRKKKQKVSDILSKIKVDLVMIQLLPNKCGFFFTVGWVMSHISNQEIPGWLMIRDPENVIIVRF